MKIGKYLITFRSSLRWCAVDGLLKIDVQLLPRTFLRKNDWRWKAGEWEPVHVWMALGRIVCLLHVTWYKDWNPYTFKWSAL